MSDPIRIIYTESKEQAAEFLRLALAEMSRRDIPPHPHNFTVWYEYVSGRNRLLRETLDQLIESGGKFSEETSQDLYLRFFVKDEHSIEPIRKSLLDTIHDMQKHVSTTGGSLSQYADTLGHFAELLQDNHALQSISNATGQVLIETRNTEQTSLKLDSQLTNMAGEVEALRRELDSIREESLTDGLTSIGNRKAFDINLGQAVRQSNENRTPFTLLMADIDHFKRFNDSYGHLIGDRVLRYVATQLRQCLKGQDKPFRYGGEEFAIILPRTFLSGGSVLADQIRRELAANALKDKANGKNYGHITVSIGVAQHRQGEEADSLIGRVDKALYRAKQQGRNRVIKSE